mgnify:CR=1 FL=1|jgi:N-acetylglutamate synthase
MTEASPGANSPIIAAIGKRVTIRLREASGGYRDIVGVLESESHLINAKSEKVTFAQEEIAIWREIKPLPDRAGTGAPLSKRIMALENLSEITWPAEENLIYGKWRLRISDGQTMRANSVLPTGAAPFGEPAAEISQALSEIVKTYREKKLTPAFSLPVPMFQALDTHLDNNGWRLKIAANFLIRDITENPSISDNSFDIEISDKFSEHWLEVQGDHHLEKIMLRYPAKYLTLRLGEEVLAVGRVAISESWSIITRLYVIPSMRGKGIAKELMNHLLQVAEMNGATKVALQADSENFSGLALYKKMGFRLHHRYNYRTLEGKDLG